jgi:CheY-like chemotaxis protein
VKAAALFIQDEEIQGGSETILLVEDDLSVRRLVSMQLRELGYAVLEAGNASEALKIWGQHRHEIKLLFTDVVMPGTLNGLDLAHCLKEEQPSLKIVSSSGYGANPAENSLTHWPEMVHLPKPYEPAVLARVVRRCLDKK